MKRLFCILLLVCMLIAVCPCYGVSAEENKTIRVLAIGNSYSNNTTEYVSRIAKSMGYDIEATSLYYPGCSLKQHVTKYENDIADYVLFINGKTDWQYLTLKKALTTKQYDIITLQETPVAIDFSTFYTEEEPWLTTLYSYVKEHQPNAEIMMHETWAFCTETIRGGGQYTQVFYESNAAMQEVLSANYKKAAEMLGGIKVIPFGQAVNLAVDEFDYGQSIKDRDSVYNDEISHLNKTGGYLAGCVWVEFITGADVRNATFDANILSASVLREIAHETVSGEKPTVKSNFRVIEENGGYKILRDYRPVPLDGKITIPEYIDSKSVVAVSKGIYKNKMGIKEVELPESVLKIESGALSSYKVSFYSPKQPKKTVNTKLIIALAGGVFLLAGLASVIITNKKKANITKKQVKK